MNARQFFSVWPMIVASVGEVRHGQLLFVCQGNLRDRVDNLHGKDVAEQAVARFLHLLTDTRKGSRP